VYGLDAEAIRSATRAGEVDALSGRCKGAKKVCKFR
jgi:hypothetical protein